MGRPLSRLKGSDASLGSLGVTDPQSLGQQPRLPSALLVLLYGWWPILARRVARPSSAGRTTFLGDFAFHLGESFLGLGSELVEVGPRSSGFVLVESA